MSAIPIDVVSCPLCAGELTYGETLADLLEEQTRAWRCSGNHTGTLSLKVKVRSVPASPEPPLHRVGTHFAARPKVRP